MWYKRWKVWLGVFVALIVIGAFLPDPPSEVAKKEKVAAITESINAGKKAEEKASEDSTKEKAEASEKEKKPTKEPAYTAENETRVLEAYDRIIAESEGVIVNIGQEDDYEIVNVQLDDDFAYMPVDLKQQFVDEFGKKIEGNTRAILFGRGIADKVYVYFKNSKGEHLVKTKHLDYGWKAK